MEVKTDWVEFWKGLVSLFLWLCMEVMLKGCLIDACGWVNSNLECFGELIWKGL
jgi:hypothetical protein